MTEPNPQQKNSNWHMQKWNNIKTIHIDAYKWIIEVPAQFAWVLGQPFEVFQSPSSGQFVYIRSYETLDAVKEIYNFDNE